MPDHRNISALEYWSARDIYFSLLPIHPCKKLFSHLTPLTVVPMSRSARSSKQERGSDVPVLPPAVSAVAAHWVTVNVVAIKKGGGCCSFPWRRSGLTRGMIIAFISMSHVTRPPFKAIEHLYRWIREREGCQSAHKVFFPQAGHRCVAPHPRQSLICH